MKNNFDLLSTVEYGGCSAKLSAKKLDELLSNIPILKDNNVLVDISTHDDAGVYKLNDQTALIVTTDFFPPVCSDATDFGRIAAANSLSDIYAMGGKPLLVLNLNMFPKDLPLDILQDILMGGQEKINESGAFTMGGHTIEDAIPKYGLAVVGTIHPDKIITNSGLKAGQDLILTKPLGTGVIMAGRRLGIASDQVYNGAVTQMQLLNKSAAEIIEPYNITGGTDITGFGLLGHIFKMAVASSVAIELYESQIPLLPGVSDLIDQGCLPGAIFRNKEFIEEKIDISSAKSHIVKMAMLDAQTSGGLLIGVNKDETPKILDALQKSGHHPYATVIGCVKEGEAQLYFK